MRTSPEHEFATPTIADHRLQHLSLTWPLTLLAHPQSDHSRRAVLKPQPSEVGVEHSRPIEEGNDGRSHHSST